MGRFCGAAGRYAVYSLVSRPIFWPARRPAPGLARSSPAAKGVFGAALRQYSVPDHFADLTASNSIRNHYRLYDLGHVSLRIITFFAALGCGELKARTFA